MAQRHMILGIAGLLGGQLLFAQGPDLAPPQFRGIPSPPPSATPPRLLETAPTSAPAETVAAKPAPPVAPAPCVMVEKRGPDTVNAGQALVYDIVVRNRGNVAVYNVRIEDELPQGSRFIASEPAAEARGTQLTWGLGQLDANAEKRIRVEIQPSGEGEFRATATATFSLSASLKTQIVRPQLTVALTGPDRSMAGDVVPLQIQIANPGTGTATNVVLRVKLPEGLTHPGGSHIEADVGTLAPGETKTLPLRVNSAAGGNQTAEIEAIGDGGLESSAKTQVLVQQPKLQLRRSGPAKVMYRGEVVEEYELTNPGNAPASNVTVTEVLPAGFEFVGASDGAMFDPVARAVTWKIGEHAPGAIRTVVLKAKATTVGELATRAVAIADRCGEVKTDGTIAVEGVPALRLEVADLEDAVEVGGTLTYEIRVQNQGSCPCTGIRIVCDVPEGLAILETSGAAPGIVQPNKVTFDVLPKLATKADAVFRVKVRGDQAGDFRFRVQMTCEQLRLPVNKEESSRVYKN